MNCVVWDAALALAGYLQKLHEKNPKIFDDGKTCIELGAGLGLCGMLAAYYNAEVTITDMEETLGLLKHNVEENKKVFPQMKANVKEFVWSKESAEDLLVDGKSFDYILIADCIYYKESIDPLVETLKVLVQPHTTLLISQELRESKIQVELYKEFLMKVREFLIIREIPASEQHPNYHCEEIMIFSCKRK